jgi:uncharacterized protein
MTIYHPGACTSSAISHYTTVASARGAEHDSIGSNSSIGRTGSISMSAQPQPLRRTDQIQDILRGLRSSSSEVIGAAIVNSEGFTVATALPGEVDEEVVAGMGAALLGVAERISSELMDAEMVQTYVRSANGYIILNAVNEDAILIVLTTDKAKLGLVFLDIKKRLPDLTRML